MTSTTKKAPSSPDDDRNEAFKKIFKALNSSNKLEAGTNNELNRMGLKLSELKRLMVEMHDDVIDQTHKDITRASEIFVGETDRQLKEAMTTLVKYLSELEKPLGSIDELFELVKKLQSDMEETKNVIKNRLDYGQTLEEEEEKDEF